MGSLVTNHADLVRPVQQSRINVFRFVKVSEACVQAATVSVEGFADCLQAFPGHEDAYVDDLDPADMVRRVVDFVHWTYVDRHGIVQCVVRWFLDRLFCGMDFDDQLRRVWITQSRLCSLDKSGARYREPLYRLCRDEYLTAQLRLLPRVPIVAFGGKAQEALRRLKVPAIEVPHPAARGTEESKREEWERAITKLKAAGRIR